MPSARKRRRRLRLVRGGTFAVGLALMGAGRSAIADPQPVPVPTVPLQIQPTVPEIGMGDWIPPAEGSQPGDPTQGGTGTGSGGGVGGVTGSSDALSLMQQQSWGQQASSDAQALGVNPNAVAATCMIESGCDSSAQNGSSTGAFQMQGAAFEDGLSTALKADPSLASQIVPGSAGINDPVTESIAASGYLMQANQALQNAGVQNPTVVDARSYYEFGPSQGTAVAVAEENTPMSELVSATALSSNNIPGTETVAEWRSSVTAKTGGAGDQSVLS